MPLCDYCEAESDHYTDALETRVKQRPNDVRGTCDRCGFSNDD